MEPGSPIPDPLIGRELVPGCRLVRRIGSGGMGVVYEADHQRLGRRVAVKVLNKELAADPLLFGRFQREAQITASFKNAHVVKIHEFDLLRDGVPFMVMELLQGEDLQARLTRVKQLSPELALELGRSAARALDQAHLAGVIHRDVKPGNLFFAREGNAERVKLLDFGIARSQQLTGEGLTVFGQVLGTVWYMSPEQARGEELTPASDLYSLAVVLFEALGGALPFVSETPHQYLFRLQSDAPRSLSQLAPQLPMGIDTVFARALSRDPKARFATASAFIDALAGTFQSGTDHTQVRLISESGLRPPPPPPPPRKTATDPRIRVASDARLRAAPPVAETADSTQIARILTPPTPLPAVPLPPLPHADPITLDEDRPSRPLPPPPPPGRRATGSFTPLQEDEGSTRVLSVQRPQTAETPQPEESTRVVLAPGVETPSSAPFAARPVPAPPPPPPPTFEAEPELEADAPPLEDEADVAPPPTTPSSGNARTVLLGLGLGLALLALVGAGLYLLGQR
jgi:serine/threonine protein kinase